MPTTPQTAPPRRAAALCAAGFAVGALVTLPLSWWARPGPRAPSAADSLPGPPLRPVAAEARTDGGRPVRLYQRVAPDPGPPPPEVQQARRAAEAALGLARTGPADEACNCHGWTFAGGWYWVLPEDVDTILEDNAYAPVAAPAPGDLIVYRDRSGRAVHSGVVRATRGGARALVESRWGEMGRFVHAQHHQCFSDRWTFYRSPRQGHRLQGVMAPGEGRAGRGAGDQPPPAGDF
jgi:hypothetical protein